MMLILQIVLLVLGLLLTVAVLLQHGKSYGLSGTIAGGAETFFGKERGSKLDKMLARFTTIVGILFVVVALLVFIMQPGGYDPTNRFNGFSNLVESVTESTGA